MGLRAYLSVNYLTFCNSDSSLVLSLCENVVVGPLPNSRFRHGQCSSSRLFNICSPLFLDILSMHLKEKRHHTVIIDAYSNADCCPLLTICP